MPQGTIGFIYKITNHIEEKIYVGKKHLTKGKNWCNYWGSSVDLTYDIKKYKIEDKENGITRFSREILKYCDTNIRMTYYEVHYQCLYSVLTTNSYNKSILGKFYKGRI
jgi:hypothetical protein